MSRVPPPRPQAVAIGVFAIGSSAVAEGVVAATAAVRGDAGAVGGAAACVGAAAIVFASLLGPTIVAAALAGTRGSRNLGGALRSATSGSAAAVTVALGAAVLIAAGAGVTAGRRLLDLVTAPFAVAGAVLATVLGLLLALAILYPISARFARGLPRIARSPFGLSFVWVAAGAAVAWGLVRANFPVPWVIAPAAFFAGLGLAFAPGVNGLLGRLTYGRRGLIVLVALVGLAAGTTATLGALPSAARPALTHHAPYAANVLSVLFKASDRDGDGFSPLLFGGDCDDANAAVHPGAREIPENGIDENCSGTDAQRWRAPEEPSERPEIETRQNVVIIMMDALRPDHLGFAGYERPTSPNLDAFREQAVFFENAYTSAPSTRFAMATLFTGVDARRLPHDDLGRNRFRLREGAQTLARILSRERYDTQGFTISYVVQHNLGLGQGFRQWRSPWPTNQWRGLYPVMAERTTEAVLGYLEQRGGGPRADVDAGADGPTDAAPPPVRAPNRDRPFFLFAHYRCTHDPYSHYDEWDYGTEPVDKYDSSLNYCDEQIGVVLDALAARDDWDRTTVVFLSDHGELFGEFGFTNHGNTIYEPDIRIALLARIPGIEGGTVTTPVTIADVAPTVLDVTGASRPDSMDGWSLLVHLGPGGQREMGERPLFFFTDLWRGRLHHQASGVIEWPHKYIYDVSTDRRQLFDLVDDAAESEDLAEREAERAVQLADMLDVYESPFIEEPDDGDEEESGEDEVEPGAAARPAAGERPNQGARPGDGEDGEDEEDKRGEGDGAARAMPRIYPTGLSRRHLVD